MDLKTLSQRTQIRDHELKHAWAICAQPAHLADLPKELPDDAALPVAIVAILLNLGLEGPVVREILKRTKVQIEDKKTLLNVDFRGDVPVKLQIDITQLRLRLGLCKH